MKFTQLQIGQRFLYQGKTYRKATPLMADLVDREGQRLIPRSAPVEPLDAAPHIRCDGACLLVIKARAQCLHDVIEPILANRLDIAVLGQEQRSAQIPVR